MKRPELATGDQEGGARGCVRDYSITASAVANSVGGTSNPIAFAALSLMMI